MTLIHHQNTIRKKNGDYFNTWIEDIRVNMNMSLSIHRANKMSSLISEPHEFLRLFLINSIFLFYSFCYREKAHDVNNNDYKWCHKAETCLHHQPQRTCRKWNDETLDPNTKIEKKKGLKLYFEIFAYKSKSSCDVLRGSARCSVRRIGKDAHSCINSKSIQQMGSCQFDWFKMPSEFLLYSILQILIIPTMHLEAVHASLYFFHMYFQT